MKKAIAIATMAIMLMGVVPPLYGSGEASLAYAQSQIRLDSSGATFAFPLIDLWRVKYQSVVPEVKFVYNSVGSGAGVGHHINKIGQFGATDAPLTDAEYGAAPGTITIPEMIGAISIPYNIPEVPKSGLNLSAEALCGIFLEDIDSWNDPLITDANPDVVLPDESILTVHRSDGSGTTFAFTSYLSKVCPEWDERVGAAKSVPWPGGLGSPGNEGVAGTIRTTDYSIGYVTLAYAFQVDMNTADIENGDKTNYVSPTIDTASAASGAAAFWLPNAGDSWRGVDLLAAPGFDSYPITSFSYLIVHPDLAESADSKEQAKATVDLMAWMITGGQAYSSQLLYVPIADLVRNIGLDGLAQVTYNGEKLYAGPTSVWESGTSSGAIDAWIGDRYDAYADGEMDQSTFLNLMGQVANLHEMYAAGLIDDSRLGDALVNLLR